MWGIPNNLNDILITQFKHAFYINRFEAGLLQSAFYLGYFLLSIPAAIVLKKYGYKVGLLIGLSLYSTGCFLFYPSAMVQQYNYFLFSIFVIASGLAFLETGANSFITAYGDPQTSEKRLNFAQSFNPLGSIFGLLIGTIFIFADKPGTQFEEIMRIVRPYLFLGFFVVLLAIAVWKTKFPDNIEENDDNNWKDVVSKIKILLKRSHFVLGVFAEFCYVGAQVGTWSYYIQYFEDNADLTQKTAGYLLTFTLILFAIGRFVSTYIMSCYSPNRLVGVYAAINVFLTLLGVFGKNYFGGLAIGLTSFFMAPMFPTIFALSVKDLGTNAKLGGSMVIMSIVGGAVFTPFMGHLAVLYGNMSYAYLIPTLCYLFITYYAFVGSKFHPTRGVI